MERYRVELPIRSSRNCELKCRDECSYEAATETECKLKMVIHQFAPAEWGYNANLSDVTVTLFEVYHITSKELVREMGLLM